MWQTISTLTKKYYTSYYINILDMLNWSKTVELKYFIIICEVTGLEEFLSIEPDITHFKRQEVNPNICVYNFQNGRENE